MRTAAASSKMLRTGSSRVNAVSCLIGLAVTIGPFIPQDRATAPRTGLTRRASYCRRTTCESARLFLPIPQDHATITAIGTAFISGGTLTDVKGRGLWFEEFTEGLSIETG